MALGQPVPLPPLPEQRRIVAKVAEMMVLCNQLEAAQELRELHRCALRSVSLHRLTPTDDDIRTNVESFIAMSPRLITTSEHVEGVRLAVLNMAVQGRLVAQDPDDEPAVELVTRIQADKSRLVAAGLIKFQSAQPPVASSDLEYSLPNGWEATRIGDLLTVIRGASPRPKGDPKYFSKTRTPYHWIKISDIKKHSVDRILQDTDEFLTEAGMKKSVLLPRGTLVVTNSATIGVPIILGIDGGCIHDGYLAFPLFPDAELSADYFFVLFQTLKAYAVKRARGMAQLNLNTGLVREFPLGLPPLAEQHRIVARVDELMAVCDELEATLVTTRNQKNRLLEALLRDVLDQAARNGDAAEGVSNAGSNL
jgi:type I restriction enzyme S subunit